MTTLKMKIIAGILVIHSVSANPMAWTQSTHSLRSRISKADQKKYHSIRDGKDWKNPYLVIGGDGIYILGVTAAEKSISLEAVESTLERLPDSAWPYGLVVAVQDASIISGEGELPRIEANRKKLLKLLKKLGVTVDRWPS